MVPDPSSIDDITEKIPYPQQPHVATVLLVDTSGSMGQKTANGKRKIDELNEGLTLSDIPQVVSQK
jgi:nitric oxide reductase activation protein